MNKLFFILSFCLVSLKSQAMLTELGVSYAEKKTYFDINNYNNMASITGSISFYFMEKLAIELSYTDASILREESIYNGTGLQQQTTLQKVLVYGSDLIVMLADRKAVVQPYVKGGISQVKKTLTTKSSEVLVYETSPINSISPSYGAGIKISLTESFGIKLSYDAWRTESKDSNGNKSTIEDTSIRAGLTWIL
ncbi:MAG: outer membrane beta-barrel protein [Bdellovibrionaceae bacterium]|nr:outer membrane beta-barrel protein [Pseudobdellovibrionaceae bacterium]